MQCFRVMSMKMSINHFRAIKTPYTTICLYICIVRYANSNELTIKYKVADIQPVKKQFI